MPVDNNYTDLRARAAMAPEIQVSQRLLYNSFTSPVLDWEGLLLKEAGGTLRSIDWGNRQLINNVAGGTLVYDWQAATFSTAQTFSTLTASRAVITDGSKVLVSSATTATELGYVNGVTGAIQAQLDNPLSAQIFS